MIAMGLLTLSRDDPSDDLALVAGSLSLPEDLFTQELDDLLEPAVAPADSSMFSPAEGALAKDQPSFEPTIDAADAPDMSVALDQPVLPPTGAELMGEIPVNLEGRARTVVAGRQQAVDRITDELIGILLKNDVLLIWCFDQSNSMKPDREDIRQRVRKIYAELKVSPFAHGDAMLTSVTSFGQGFLVHTETPTNDFDQIEEAIDAIEEDPSGIERMCQAVNKAIETHRRHAADRKMVLILVTDESGDPGENLAYLEKTIEHAQETASRIYVMGREASFGHPYTVVRYTDPKTKKTWTIDDVDRGPESAFFEVLQFDGFGRRTDLHRSGFGPYDLVRMARETGGTYFLLPDKSLSEEEAKSRERLMRQMRHYIPETDPRGEYVGARSRSPLRQTIWQVITGFNVWDDNWLKQIRFLRSLPADPTRLAGQAAGGMNLPRRLIRDYDGAIASLERVAEFRKDEPKKRWQANYDLLLAQLVAYRARAAEYLACLESAAKKPPKPAEAPKPEMMLASWSLRNTKELFAEAKNKADVDRAAQLLGDIVKNHPDTPWAQRAEWELKRPFGYQMVANFRPVPKPTDVAAKPKPPRPKTPRKPAPPKPVRPKL
jgi:hypothetical protein